MSSVLILLSCLIVYISVSLYILNVSEIYNFVFLSCLKTRRYGNKKIMGIFNPLPQEGREFPGSRQWYTFSPISGFVLNLCSMPWKPAGIGLSFIHFILKHFAARYLKAIQSSQRGRRGRFLKRLFYLVMLLCEGVPTVLLTIVDPL